MNNPKGIAYAALSSSTFGLAPLFTVTLLRDGFSPFEVLTYRWGVASAALLLNALKAMAGIRKDMDLISNQVIEPISALKIQSLGHHNPRLHSDEVLIALAISALTNPLADMARAQLGSLRGCDAHFSVIISEEDVKLYKRLGIHVSCEPKYEYKRLYHK